jgi:adenosylmethionine-8-amino-7-oxononanoate aminotransferase
MQTAGPPINIVRGEGSYLYDTDGKKFIDAGASWWTNLHGHAHPHIAQAIAAQAAQLEQVIFAGFTHPSAIQLADRLLQRIPYHTKVFYSDNGSTAVEAAIKMALQYWWNKGHERNRIIAFTDAYHGDTFGSMSVSARGVFTSPYQRHLFDIDFLETPNYTNGDRVVAQLKEIISSDHAAFIFEPLVLGSAGMLMYPPDVLCELIEICNNNGVLTIADEVMTGFGRTGKFLATDYCTKQPDIICLSKGITGGFMPFAATTCTQHVYDAFLSDDKAKMLFHGHSYTGNPLGCAAGLASLEVFENENTFGYIERIANKHKAFADILKGNPSVLDVRQTGTILAIELQTGTQTGYLNTVRDKAYQYFLGKGIIMRPLGNVIYLLPPYCITDADLDYIYTEIGGFLLQLS